MIIFNVAPTGRYSPRRNPPVVIPQEAWDHPDGGPGPKDVSLGFRALGVWPLVSWVSGSIELKGVRVWELGFGVGVWGSGFGVSVHVILPYSACMVFCEETQHLGSHGERVQEGPRRCSRCVVGAYVCVYICMHIYI